jgi:outer membrane protein assembly factor BamD (BamD/ComL family)
MLGGGGSRDWYFYNPQLLQSGKQTFRTQWGNRTLEDNWRRMSKATSSSASDEDTNEDAIAVDSTTIDATQLTNASASETDIYKPEYYLQQIPKTEAELAESNELLARALYNMVSIYRDRVGDQALADETFRTFCQRYPEHELLKDLYYMQYLTALKNKQLDEAAKYGQEIQRLFPESQEAYIVSQPDYFSQLQQMAQEQDSLYEQTYNAYANNDFTSVKTNTQYAEEKYPLTPLMPRFLFLNAIAVAKTNGQDAFVGKLQDMVARYPNSELSAMAKDMLALMGQGAETQEGDLTALQTKRKIQTAEITEDSVALSFTIERHTTSLVVLIMPQDEQLMNQLLYEIALYNFSQFMIRDFDIEQFPIYDKEHSALQISGFEKMDDAEWYYNLLKKNSEMQTLFTEKGVEVICITEENAKLLGTQFSLQDYLDWQAESSN